MRSKSADPLTQPKNRILSALPKDEYSELRPLLSLATLPLGTVLYEATQVIDHVWFPTTALVSIVATTEDGSGVEVGMVGYEGAVGVSVIMGKPFSPFRTVVQSPGEALKITAVDFREAVRSTSSLCNRILAYTHARMMQLSQSCVCNRFHTVEERLCRWLLLANDRIKHNELPFTQEFLSYMIGARRQAVNVVAHTLQDAGMIRYSRGRVTILDRQGLEASSCECYRVIKDEYDLYLAFQP